MTEHGGHDDHGGQDDHGGHGGHGDQAAQFRKRFWLTLGLTVPVVIWSHHVQMLLGYTAPPVPLQEFIGPVLGSVIFWYGGWPFLSGGASELRSRRPGMMLLISLAITVAYVASMATAIGIFEQEIWWELSLLIAIMLLGHWIEMRAIGQAQGALAALAELLPDEADRVRPDGTVETVPVDALALGDTVLVRPGARVPVDGTVREGRADVDESMITGESNPAPRGEGDRVVAGTVVADSSLRVEVTAIGDDTSLAGIRRLIEQAQASRSRSQVLADRAAALLFYVALASGAVTGLVWVLLGQPAFAIDRTVTVLVIACPHALGLAIPLVTAISTAKSSRAGILVTDRLALERMRTIDAVLFDKTGTLTRGRHAVSDVAAAPGTDIDEVLRLAGAVEADSEHPLAKAIHAHAVERAGSRSLSLARDFRSLTGRGVQAEVDGAAVAVGGPALLRGLGLAVPAPLGEWAEPWTGRGAAVLHVVRDGAVVGAVALEDEIRDVSREAVRSLQEAGVTVAMITGDARPVAEAVGRELGIDEVFAEVLPQDKEAKVAELQARGMSVAMVGDGVNDAPALARADVGIAIGAGTDVAVQSAGIVLASDDPRGVLAIRTLSKATYRKMVENLWWAAGYNVVAIPLAAGVLAPVGFVLPMALGAVLMSTSTIIVALNAQLLRRVRLAGLERSADVRRSDAPVQDEVSASPPRPSGGRGSDGRAFAPRACAAHLTGRPAASRRRRRTGSAVHAQCLTSRPEFVLVDLAASEAFGEDLFRCGCRRAASWAALDHPDRDDDADDDQGPEQHHPHEHEDPAPPRAVTVPPRTHHHGHLLRSAQSPNPRSAPSLSDRTRVTAGTVVRVRTRRTWLDTCRRAGRMPPPSRTRLSSAATTRHVVGWRLIVTRVSGGRATGRRAAAQPAGLRRAWPRVPSRAPPRRRSGPRVARRAGANPGSRRTAACWSP